MSESEDVLDGYLLIRELSRYKDDITEDELNALERVRPDLVQYAKDGTRPREFMMDRFWWRTAVINAFLDAAVEPLIQKMKQKRFDFQKYIAESNT